LSIATKIAIVREAYSVPKNIKPVARKYNISPSNLRRWFQLFFEKQTIDELALSVVRPREEYKDCGLLGKKRRVAKRTRKNGAGRKKVFSEALIQQLKSWFDMRRQENLSVTLRLIAAEAKRFDPTVLDLRREQLKHRLYRLLASWDISWRRCTHKAQNTRHNIAICTDFVNYVKSKVRILGIDYANIYNVDETNVPFSQEHKHTYAERGSRTVGIKGSNTAQRCTVMLGANMTGDRKLTPFVIFKGVNSRGGTVRREVEGKVGYPRMLEYGVQPKAWMDESLMLEWIDKVWKPHTTTIGSLTYLLLDECTVHMTDSVREAFTSCNTCIDFIPGGHTSKLQPMDLGVNKPFKDYLRNAFDDWLIDNMHHKPKRHDASKWIEQAWDSIKISTIKNSFRHAGLQLLPDDEGADDMSVDDDEDPGFDPLSMN
jgi:hypothetical protein